MKGVLCLVRILVHYAQNLLESSVGLESRFECRIYALCAFKLPSLYHRKAWQNAIAVKDTSLLKG